MPEKFLSVKELAEVLGISSASVYQHARAGRLPHHRLGDRLLFRLDEVLDATRAPVAEADFENHKIALRG